jgi:hypothetical protein
MPANGEPPLSATNPHLEDVVLRARPTATHAKAFELAIPQDFVRCYELVDCTLRNFGSHIDYIRSAFSVAKMAGNQMATVEAKYER